MNQALPRLWLALSVSAALSGCARDQQTRPWRAEDHDINKKAVQVASSVAPGTEHQSLVLVAYQQHCQRCHGARGRGDGPEGRMMRTPDLTRASFQERTSDADIAAVIRSGRNKMPAFKTLPPKVIDGLVELIRVLGGRKNPTAQPSPSGAPPPSPSASPTGSTAPTPSASAAASAKP